MCGGGEGGNYPLLKGINISESCPQASLHSSSGIWQLGLDCDTSSAPPSASCGRRGDATLGNMKSPSPENVSIFHHCKFLLAVRDYSSIDWRHDESCLLSRVTLRHPSTTPNFQVHYSNHPSLNQTLHALLSSTPFNPFIHSIH